MAAPRKSRGDLPKGMVKRGNVYWADIQVKGRRIRESLGGNLSLAKELLVELRARALRGQWDRLDNDYQVKKLEAAYLRHCRQANKPGTAERYKASLDAILPHMPARVSRITIRAVLDFREKRGRDVCPGTVNKDVETLSRMLNWAARHELIRENPIQGIKPLPHDEPKEGRALERAEVQLLLAESPQPWRDIWYAFLVTGMRSRELACLTFDDIDWTARELIVRRGVAKNHMARRIPIDDGLWAILCKQRDGRGDRKPGWGRRPEVTERIQARFTTDHVFVTTQNTPLSHRSGVYYALMRCCRRAGIETRRMRDEEHELNHVDVHSFRRTFATDLIENGADPKRVQQLLGHKTLAMTMDLYAKVRAGSTREAIGRLSYGCGVQAPAHLVEFPTVQAEGNHHNYSTTPQKLGANG